MNRRPGPALTPTARARAPLAEGERVQKVLAEAGVASRRQVEAWIRAGRITVNGAAATLGQHVVDKDVILVDGRRVRLTRAKAETARVLLYHRPPGEALSAAVAGTEAAGEPSSYDRLPGLRGHRWLPLSPLAPIDSGLEVFTTDGALRAAAGKVAHSLESRYAVRLRGEYSAEWLLELPARAGVHEPPFEILAAEGGGGEGHNVWINFQVRGARGRDLRTLIGDAGFEVSRVIRTHYGPLGMDRSLARGRHRELEDEERDALYQALGLAVGRRVGRGAGAASGAPRPQVEGTARRTVAGPAVRGSRSRR